MINSTLRFIMVLIHIWWNCLNTINSTLWNMKIFTVNVLSLIELINCFHIGFCMPFQICYTSASVVYFWLEIKFRNTWCINSFFLYFLFLLESLAIPHESFRDWICMNLFGILVYFFILIEVINYVTIIFICRHVVLNPWCCSIRNYSWWNLHFLQMNVFTLLYNQFFCCNNRLVMVSGGVFFNEFIKLFWIFQLLLMILGVVVTRHQDWFKCTVVKQLLILVLFPSNLNVLLFILIHFYL